MNPLTASYKPLLKKHHWVVYLFLSLIICFVVGCVGARKSYEKNVFKPQKHTPSSVDCLSGESGVYGTSLDGGSSLAVITCRKKEMKEPIARLKAFVHYKRIELGGWSDDKKKMWSESFKNEQLFCDDMEYLLSLVNVKKEHNRVNDFKKP